jgi:hypothetical protein
MRRRTTNGDPVEEHPRCLCMGLGPKLTAMLECRSEVAREHFLNARLEILKALRTLIDERIEHLSRPRKKGTKVAVE